MGEISYRLYIVSSLNCCVSKNRTVASFAFMCELYDYVENTELPPEMVSALLTTKNVLELSWDEWMMNIEVEDMEDSIEKVAELLRERKI